MNSTKPETGKVRSSPLENMRGVVAIEPPSGDKVPRGRCGFGGLPPACPPMLGKTAAAYETFCTDWFMAETTFLAALSERHRAA